MEKGFITIATGKEEYYVLARNLLRSYRYFCKEPLPFAILADRQNEYTAEFDDVLIFENSAGNSYLDKLELGVYLPYNTTIFIDADCLAYGDLNKLFQYFEQADDFSCFGRVLPLDDKTGWFEYSNLGEFKSKVNYVVGLHGGIYYMRKSEMSRQVFETAKALVSDYPKFKFKGKFDTPGDEPLIALSMALNNCKPIPFKGPVFRRAERIGKNVTLHFETAAGLKSRTAGKLRGFEAAGPDGKFHPAKAEIRGNRVILTADTAPVLKVRYAWGRVPECDLADNNNLPAGPFLCSLNEKQNR